MPLAKSWSFFLLNSGDGFEAVFFRRKLPLGVGFLTDGTCKEGVDVLLGVEALFAVVDLLGVELLPDVEMSSGCEVLLDKSELD